MMSPAALLKSSFILPVEGSPVVHSGEPCPGHGAYHVPGRAQPRNRGCLRWVRLLPLVVVLGLAAGLHAGAADLESSQTEKGISRSRSLWCSDNIQNLHDETAVREVLRGCEGQLRQSPDSHELHLKIAYLYYRLGWLFVGKDERKFCYFRLFDHASRAVELAPQDYRSALLLAVAKAKIVGYLPHADQVRIARELARESESLVRRHGDDPDSLHLLSWLNFKIGSLSSLQKMLAAAFFGGLPSGLDIDQAFILMERAMQLRPDSVVYQYDLGYYYLRTGVKDKARRQFEQVLARRPQTAEERVYQRRAMTKMSEINGEN
nr:hypothetical protein [uncultured Desulfobulbus sp.]